MKKRNKHNLSHYHLFSCDMGQLIPVSCVEALPGDTFQGHHTALIRTQPLIAPVMHNVEIHFGSFFAPYRTLWSGWEDFITGESEGLFPTMSSTATAGDVMDHLGVPRRSGIQVSQLPVRAYNAIVNEYFRDQDLVPERSDIATNLANVAWNKDYFTTARPWTQKGGDVTIPLGDQAVVRGLGSNVGAYGIGATVTESDGTSVTYTNANDGSNILFEKNPDGVYPNVYADLSSATAVDVLDLRRAFALQRYREARAQYGSRYTEYLRYLGVTPSDARLQRPELLSHSKARLNFSEVLQTTPAEAPGEYGVGDLYGHGISGVKTNRYRKFFEEHGVVMTVMWVRPSNVYQEGLHRSWLKRTKEDYWQMELEDIGQQPIYKNEVYLTTDAAGGYDTFGFSDRYAEYRSQPSLVSGDYRTTLQYWHLARQFSAATALNEDFVKCVPDKRIFQVPSEDGLWCMVNNHVVARRLIGKRKTGRVM